MGFYFVAAAVLGGFGLGFWRAGRHGGVLADRMQWGVVHGIAALLLAVVLSFVVAMSTG